MFRLANPGRFLRLSNRWLPVTAIVTLLLFCIGLYLALVASPEDYQQGVTVRIMYVHVPAAWMALMVYSLMAAASAVYLVWKHPLADMAARASAPLGAGFAAIALITGALWGKPMWGTWWVWDARLTSMLILFFIYLGYIVLADAFDDPEQGAKPAALLALFGFVNIPIIKFSVDWWHTLHQPASILRSGGPAIHPSMLWPLLMMALAFAGLYCCLLLLRLRSLILEAKIRRARHAALMH